MVAPPDPGDGVEVLEVVPPDVVVAPPPGEGVVVDVK